MLVLFTKNIIFFVDQPSSLSQLSSLPNSLFYFVAFENLSMLYFEIEANINFVVADNLTNFLFRVSSFVRTYSFSKTFRYQYHQYNLNSEFS